MPKDLSPDSIIAFSPSWNPNVELSFHHFANQHNSGQLPDRPPLPFSSKCSRL
jgi:hypothetical protein